MFYDDDSCRGSSLTEGRMLLASEIMPIMRPDGTPYRLQHPNPIAMSQARWDMSEITFHNFDFIADSATEVRQSVAQPKPQPKPTTPPQEVAKRQPLPPIENLLTTELEPEVAPAAPQLSKRAPRNDEVISWCLPAHYEEKVDEFYGTRHNALVYGKQFLFPAIVAAMNDLSFQFWTTDPERKITEKSVVYPREFANGKPVKQYRWWQVIRIQEHQNGYLYTATPSTYTPTFDARG